MRNSRYNVRKLVEEDSLILLANESFFDKSLICDDGSKWHEKGDNNDFLRIPEVYNLSESEKMVR